MGTFVKLAKKRRLLFISIAVGLVGLCVNLFPMQLFLYRGIPVQIQPGLILPLFIALCFGLKYGMICAALAILPLWFNWGSDGYGVFYSMPVMFAWFAWHGFKSDQRRRHPIGRWYHDMYIAEMVFRIVSTVGFIFLYPLLVAQNPPFWDSSHIYRNVSGEMLGIMVFCHIVCSFIILTVCDAALQIRPLRKVLGLAERRDRMHWILPIAISIGLVLVSMDALGCVLFQNNETFGYFEGLLNFSYQHVFVRSLMLVTCTVFGVIVYAVLNRHVQQQRMLESTSAAIQRKNRELIDSQQELSQSQLMLKTYVDKAPYGIFLTDDTSAFVDCNDQALAMTGYSKNDMRSMKMTGLVIPGDKKQVSERFADMSDQRLGFVISMQMKVITKRGMIREWAVKITRMRAQQLLAYAEDITDKEVYRRRLEYVSKHDTLTGMHNKSSLSLFMERTMRAKHKLPISIIYCDINGMRRINENHGYGFGDSVVCEFGKELEQFFDGIGTVFHVGGDSFVIVMCRSSHDKCCKLLGKLAKAVKKVGTDDIPISAAMGCATIVKNDREWQDAMRLAESRMYAGKIIQEDSLRSIVMSSFMKALFERSSETEEHVQRIKHTAERIAVAMGLGRDEVDGVVLAAQFHDIGKMGIPDSILFKPGRLTEEEWIVMQKHCEIGHRIVSAAADMTEVAGYVLSHHERWDGSGYPQGLKGEEIPMASRIVAVADAYDAMTNERVYKEKSKTDAAIDEIRRCSGSQFDPSVVDAFLRVREEDWRED